MITTATKYQTYIAVVTLFLVWAVVPSNMMGQDSTFTVTVEDQSQEHPRYDEGFDDKFAIDGSQDPGLTLERGKTYFFVMDDVPSTHPFYLTTSSQGLGAEEYNDGVTNNGATGNDTLKFTPPNDAPSSLYYQCVNHSYMGAEMTITGEGTGIASNPDEVPRQMVLEPNFPNPFNPTTTIEFGLSESQFVRLDVYNAAGIKVETLTESRYQAGRHTLTFDAAGLSSGAYLVRMQAGDEILTRTMTLMK